MGCLECDESLLRGRSEVIGLMAKGSGSPGDGGYRESMGIEICLKVSHIRSPVPKREIAGEGGRGGCREREGSLREREGGIREGKALGLREDEERIEGLLKRDERRKKGCGK